MRVCGHFEARRTIRHDPNDVAPKRKVVSSSLAGGAKNPAASPFSGVCSVYFIISSRWSALNHRELFMRCMMYVC